MTTEKLLVRTKDNCVMVFDITFTDGNIGERARLKQQCEGIASSINYRDGYSITLSAGTHCDAGNTEFLNKEISGYHYRKDRTRFANRLRDDPPVQPNTFYLSHRMGDNEFPEIIKNLGFEVVPVDKEYEARFNAASGQFEAHGFDKTCASVDSANRRLEVVRNHFHLLPEDYRLLEDLKARFEREKRTNPRLSERDYAQDHLTDQKERALFFFYSKEIKRHKHLDSTVSHELKHVKNAVFRSGLSLKKNAKRLQTEDYYRISVEDERSAYLDELVKNVNEYLQKGDMDDFSTFDSNNQHIVDELKRLHTPAERRAYVRNWPNLVAKKLQNFETNFRADYDRDQFIQEVNNRIDEAPLAAQKDTDHSEFKKLRSLFYNYQIYNPDTHRMEQVNLARHITPDLEVTLNHDAQQTIANAEAALQQRQQKFERDRCNGVIDTNLIEQAKTLMRSSTSNSEYVTEIDNFRISELYNDDTNSPTPPAPTPPVPDDHAEWSDELQRYWQQVDGYCEVAKNNNEYKFKINDATVRYTGKKQVEVSQNADYNLYDKMLKEPSNHAAPVEFLDTLSEKQKLLLYVACINNGRRMVGKVPTDLSGIERLDGIPPAEMERFRHRQARLETNRPTEQSRRSTSQRQRQIMPQLQQELLRRRLRGG